MTSRIDSPSSAAEEAMLSALLYLHRKKRERGRNGEANPRYARILDHFQERARRLHDERLVTDELLERLFEGGKNLPPRAPHQELEIQGPAGGRAAGRLNVRNGSGAPARFELVVGAPIDGGRSPRLECEPPGATLAAGESRLVRVAADLSGFAPGQAVTLALECRWRTGRDYVWLVVRARAEGRR